MVTENLNDGANSEMSNAGQTDSSENVTNIEETDGFILKESEELVESADSVLEESPDTVTVIDYSDYSKQELVDALSELINNNPVTEIRNSVEVIKAVFYKKHKAEIEEKREAFLNAGGIPEDFQPAEDIVEENFKQLHKKYKDARLALNEKLEKEKLDNLKAKYQIIEEIKVLVGSKESINKTFHDFRELQKKWREIGPVPQAEVNKLWQTYHHHVESFYDVIKINQELRDLDLKKNMEEKLKLCERAEELLIEPMVIKAFQKLQSLHEQWREIGPVTRDKQEEIWERFKQVTSAINKRHQEYFDSLKAELENNLNAKVLICEQAEEILKQNLNSPKLWDDKTKELIELQKLWKTIGLVPKKTNTKIFQRFKEASDSFFAGKKEYFKFLKEGQNNNLQVKTELCIQVEGLKDSADWKKTTDEIISLQKKWKETGPVPNKHSDILWKRFRAACDHFFNRKEEHFASVSSTEKDNLKLKNELIESIVTFVPTEDSSENLSILKEFQSKWTQIGHVPIKHKEDVQKRYREAVNKLYGTLKIERNAFEMMQFKNRVEGFGGESKNKDKIYSERSKIQDRIKALESDLNLWENNIGFFAKSKNADSLIKDFVNKIEKAKAEIVQQKEKLKVLDNASK